MNDSRKRLRSMAVLTIAASLMVALFFTSLILEILFRVFFPQPLGVSYRSEMSVPVHTPDYTFHRKESEFEMTTTFNSLGLRDREYETPKPENTYRILVLGDSITAALEVSDEEVYTEILEASLNQPVAAASRYEVINAGVSGFGQGDQLKMFDYVGVRLEPDLVLVQMSPINDLSENLFCRWYRVEEGEIRSLDEIPPSLPIRLEETLGRHSHFVQFLRTRLHSKLGKQAEYLQKTFDHKQKYHDFLLKGTGEMTDFSDDWCVTFAYLKALHLGAEESNAEFAVLIRPLDQDVVGTRTDPYPRDLINEFCDQEGIPCLDLTDPFREKAEGDLYRIRFRTDSHWTPTGHRWAAGEIYPFLIDLGVIGQSQDDGTGRSGKDSETESVETHEVR